MSESPHRTRRQGALYTRKAFVGLAAIVTVATVLFVAVSRRPKSTEWIPYSPDAFKEKTSEGKSLAVLFYARWTLSADPKGRLGSPTVLQSLAEAGFVAMSADLTEGNDDGFRELKKQGFTTLPVLVLYPNTGPRLGLDTNVSESEIVSAIKRQGR